MGILSDVTPQNLLEEKEKFFQDTTYNPQFIYNTQTPVSTLQAWGTAEKKLYDHAESMLYKYPSDLTIKTKKISQTEIESCIQEFNRTYTVDRPLTVIFSEALPVRCKVDASSIKFQLPIRYTHERFNDLYRHELETHILRRINHAKQPWSTYTEPELEIRRTEEGLANIHSHLYRKEKIMRKTYQSYCGVYLSQHYSFSEVYHKLLEFHMSEDLAWSIAVRCKRGFTDTSIPGAFTKDICYFEGTLAVWQWLNDRNNNPKDLYIGRLSLNSITTYKDNSVSDIQYPSFFRDIDAYISHIVEIGEVNQFTKLIDYTI